MTENSVESTVGGAVVTVRPLHATDTQLEAEFVRHLSADARRLRFLGGVNTLSAAELKLLCDVDGLRSMAFVATTAQDGRETAIGVSRYAPSSKDGASELALTVADEWQLKGIAELLMERLIAYAKEHGVRQLYSVELAENYAMKELARRLGMSAACNPDDTSQVIYSLAL